MRQHRANSAGATPEHVIRRGGRMTKWKGTAASFAPQLAVPFVTLSIFGATLAASVAFSPSTAFAACTTSGNITTCSGPTDQTTTVGTGPGDNDKTVIVEGGETITVGQRNAISLGDNANITLENGSVVTNTVNGGGGNYGTGFNTIEFNSNGTLTIETGASLIKKGGTGNAEAVNVHGFGNTIINRGLIQAENSAAIWFEDRVTGSPNTVDNYGVIERVGGNGNVLGTSGRSGIIFTNRTGAQVIGDLKFAAGNDKLIFEGGSVVTGSIDGGGGTNDLTLQGAAGSDDTLRGDIRNFTTLTKDGDGKWTVAGSLSGFTIATVKDGTLALTGNNANYTGSVIVESEGTLEARAQSLPTQTNTADNVNNVQNDGLVRFTQTDDGTYIGQITGSGAVEKVGAGVLTLAPVAGAGHTYSGGTTIKEGTIAAGADNVLGAATGGITFDGGVLRFDNEFDLASSRAIVVADGGGTVDTQGFTTTLTQGTTGTGNLAKTGSGTLVLKAENSHSGGTKVMDGTLALDVAATLSGGGLVEIASDAALGGYGTVTGPVTNSGTIAVADALPQFAGSATGNFTINGELTNGGLAQIAGANVGNKLIVNGNYNGNDGAIVLNTQLGDDASPTDQLVVNGDTAGTSSVTVINKGGLGAMTNEGIEVVAVSGASSGDFSLTGGDYQINGKDAVVGGAYAYQLYKGNRSGSDPKSWYLRTEWQDPEPNPGPGPNPNPDPKPDPDTETPDPEPLYQTGAPTYEAYPQALLGLNGVSTLQQRVGNRFWTGGGNRVVSQGADAITPYAPPEEAGVHVEGNGVWGRIEGAHNHIESRFSTTGTDYNQNVFKMQAGLDGLLTENENGTLIGGVFVQYVHGKTKTNSRFGDGEISTDGYGVGGTLTWYGNEGFYVDAQAHATWYDSDLSSTLANRGLTEGNDGFGYALSIESGKRFAINPEWSVAPQGQLVYSSVDFDDFTDSFGAPVSLDKGDSLQGRLGLTLDHETSWQNGNGTTNRSHVYGIANMYYEFLEGTKVDLAGVSLASEKDRLWGGIGLGGSYNWDDDKYSIYGEGIVNTSLNNFSDSYTLKGNVGFRVKW